MFISALEHSTFKMPSDDDLVSHFKDEPRSGLPSLKRELSQARGGGGLYISSIRMIEWGQKSNPQNSLGLPAKPKESPWTKNSPQEIQCRISEP